MIGSSPTIRHTNPKSTQTYKMRLRVIICCCLSEGDALMFSDEIPTNRSAWFCWSTNSRFSPLRHLLTTTPSLAKTGGTSFLLHKWTEPRTMMYRMHLGQSHLPGSSKMMLHPLSLQVQQADRLRAVSQLALLDRAGRQISMGPAGRPPRLCSH